MCCVSFCFLAVFFYVEESRSSPENTWFAGKPVKSDVLTYEIVSELVCLEVSWLGFDCFMHFYEDLAAFRRFYLSISLFLIVGVWSILAVLAFWPCVGIAFWPFLAKLSLCDRTACFRRSLLNLPSASSRLFISFLLFWQLCSIRFWHLLVTSVSYLDASILANTAGDHLIDDHGEGRHPLQAYISDIWVFIFAASFLLKTGQTYMALLTKVCPKNAM